MLFTSIKCGTYNDSERKVNNHLCALPLHAHHEQSIGCQVLDLYEQSAWSANIPKLAPAGYYFLINWQEENEKYSDTNL